MSDENASGGGDAAAPSKGSPASKLWGILFASVPILATLCCMYALKEWWLPPLASSAESYGADIDSLFWLITVVTGVTFIATNIALCYTIFTTKSEGRATHTHGSHTLELIWTIIPAIMLIFLALYQRETWEEIKIDMPENPDLEVRLIGQQFNWTAVYKGPDGKFDTPDDIEVRSTLVVPAKKKILVQLFSKDVLHAFFLPQLRLKQDAVPGMIIPVWFQADMTSAEYAKEHKIREKLLDNLDERVDEFALDKEQRDTLVELLYSANPYTKEGRKAYKVNKAAVEAKLGSELMESLTGKAATLGNRKAGLDQAFKWTYPIVCAELCGYQHYYMKGSLLVLPEAEFAEWMKEKTK